MNDNLSEKLKNPRLWMLIAALVLIFFPWCSYGARSGEEWASVPSSGYEVLMLSFFGYITMAFPIIALLIEISDKKIANNKTLADIKVIYIFGSLLSISGMIVAYLKEDGIARGVEVNTSFGGSIKGYTNLTLFFWLELFVFIGIIVYTVVVDYGIDKKTIQDKGWKAAFTDVTNQIKDDGKQFVDDIKKNNDSINSNNTIEQTMTCSSCGNTIPIGKKFCPKCGTKIEIQQPLPKNNTAALDNGGMTVKQYLSKRKDLKCENCGNVVSLDTKYCPDCGKELIIAIDPDICYSCGEKLVKGKAFCANCGSPVKKVKMIVNCKHCGADLIFGKKFCVECGNPVEMEVEE